MRQLLTLGDIALRLGVSEAWMRRRRSLLYASGLPRPLPLPGIARWDPAALDLWLDRFLGPSPAGAFSGTTGQFHPVPANDGAEEDPETERWAAILDRRAAALVEHE